jgi:hypothetical protein
MADEGRLVFPNFASADAAISDLERTLKHIDLKWGSDLRVDPLSPNFAGVATSYHEVRLDNAAHRIDESGFFTGTAQLLDGRWRFRNAHWSVIAPSPAVP